MAVSEADRRLLCALAEGLPLEQRPYAALARRLEMSEAEVFERLRRLCEAGVVSRFGVILRHRELGYRANAMTVWDVPDAEVEAAGRRLATLPFVTLSYRRPRRLPRWPYNLFAMIHGQDRESVERLIEEASQAAGLTDHPRAVLFSRRRFKQRGALYVSASAAAAE